MKLKIYNAYKELILCIANRDGNIKIDFAVPEMEDSAQSIIMAGYFDENQNLIRPNTNDYLPKLYQHLNTHNMIKADIKLVDL